MQTLCNGRLAEGNDNLCENRGPAHILAPTLPGMFCSLAGDEFDVAQGTRRPAAHIGYSWNRVHLHDCIVPYETKYALSNA